MAARASKATFPWTPDLGDGTYRNPILFADYSDPDVIRVGRDYWLTASSFNCTPGLPILHSHDLVNWTIVNHAIRNLPGDRYAQVQPGCGVWAPAIRYHAKRFRIFFPMVDEGVYVTTATDPRGEWSKPRLLLEGAGLIDPCPLWDDDGKAYLVHAYARSRTGIKHKLRVRPMAPDASKILGDGEIVFDDPENHPTLEGPKFHKRDGWYYLSAPAGGVATGWQVILRSRNVYGPYEPRVVLEQGKTKINGPHQGALVDTERGDWWFVHFQERQPYGRIVHLQPAEWRDGWPHIGVDRQPVARHRKPTVKGRAPRPAIPQTSDEFTARPLGLQWQWHANHEDAWYSLSARRDWLRLFAQPSPRDANLDTTPHALLQKLPAPAFAVDTLVELTRAERSTRALPLPVRRERAGERVRPSTLREDPLPNPLPEYRDRELSAGLAILGREHWAALSIEGRDGGYRLVLRLNREEVFAVKLQKPRARLRVTMTEGGRCTFAFATGRSPFRRIRKTFQAKEGHWIGAKVGVYCSGDAGHADFDYFRFSSTNSLR